MIRGTSWCCDGFRAFSKLGYFSTQRAREATRPRERKRHPESDCRDTALPKKGCHSVGVAPRCGEGDCREEGVGAPVVSRVDAAPVLETSEEVFDFIALPIQDAIIAMLNLVLGMRRNAGGDAALDKRVAEPDRAVGSICEQAMGGGQRLDHSHSCLMVAGLAFGEI
jgi:hypothetical protein